MIKSGELLGEKYSIKYLLSYGGMSEVYLAEDNFGSKVAIKRLLPKFSYDQDLKTLFFKEAKILKSLKHENIIGFIDFLDTKHGWLLVTPMIFGINLSTLIDYYKNAAILNKQNIAISVGLQVCEALSYLDYKGFMHGDISPDNIMINESGLVKLIDFGLASKNKENLYINTNLVRGKINFMSPELIKGEEFDFKSDMFSLGITLLTIYHGKTINNYLKNQNLFDLLNIDNINFKNILKKLTNISKNERFENYQDLNKAIKSICDIDNIKKSKSFLKKYLKDKNLLISYNKKIYKKLNLKYVAIIFIFLLFIISLILFNKKFSYNNLNDLIVNNIKEEQKISKEDNYIQEIPKKTNKMANGFLNLSTKPWANVFINDQFLGVTPLKKFSLPVGEYLLKLSNADLSIVKIKLIKILANQHLNLKVNLNNEGL